MPPRRILFVAKHIWKSFVERSALSRLMHPTFGSRTDMLVSSANQGYGVPLLFPAKSSAGRVNPLEVSWSVSRRGSGPWIYSLLKRAVVLGPMGSAHSSWFMIRQT